MVLRVVQFEGIWCVHFDSESGYVSILGFLHISAIGKAMSFKFHA